MPLLILVPQLRGSGIRSILGHAFGQGGGNFEQSIMSRIETRSRLIVGSRGDADISSGLSAVNNDAQMQLRQPAESSSALVRLRQRRTGRQSGKHRSLEGFFKTSLPTMTASDRLCRNDLRMGTVHIGPRQVGLLPDAEHYGRLGF